MPEMNLFKITCLVLIGVSSVSVTSAQEAVVTIPPRSVNTSLNSVAEFNCTAIATLFTWRRNGEELFVGNGIAISQPITVNAAQSILMSTLRVTVSSTNASSIVCEALKQPPPLTKDESEPALLLVQGLLESVSNLAVTPVNSTTVLISWSPPFTLEGVPILGYNVTITNTTSGENETMSVEGDTTMLYYSIDHLKSNFTITVIPMNEAGAGDKASILSTTSVVPSRTPTPLPRAEDNLAGIVGGTAAGAVIIIAALVLLIVCIICCVRKLKKKANRDDDIDLPPIPEVESSETVLAKFESDGLILSRDIKRGKKIGNGHFGEVYEARLVSSNQQVAVKACKTSHSEAVKCQFLYEADIVRHYEHPNIVKLIGVVPHHGKEPLSIVMEYVGWTFKYFLQANGSECKTEELTKMCAQVCTGMEYLEKNDCVHRSLTARNCLVSENKIVKISNFGTSHGRIHLDPSDSKLLRPAPIKWTAPEALMKNGKYTSASDVWSFGVLLWETFSFGEEPYPGISRNKVREKVKKEYRMRPPANCPPTVYDVMLKCWEYDPRNRPTFAELLDEMHKFT